MKANIDPDIEPNIEPGLPQLESSSVALLAKACLESFSEKSKHYLYNIWTIYRQCFGEYLDNTWIIFEQYLDKMYRHCFGRYLHNIWTIFGKYIYKDKQHKI